MKKILTIFFLCFAIIAPSAVYCQSKNVVEAADAAFKNGKYMDAVNLYGTAADISSDDSEKSRMKLKSKLAQRAVDLLNGANNAWNRGDVNSAVEKYEELLKLNPDDPTATARINEVNVRRQYNQQLEKAMSCFERRDYQQALQYFNKAGAHSSWNARQRDAYDFCVSDSVAKQKIVVKQQEDEPQKNITDGKKWSPAFGFALEFAPFTKPAEGAIPLEFRLLNADNRFNISVGARAAARGMIIGDSLRYTGAQNDKKYQSEVTFSYFQISPYVSLRLRMNSNFMVTGGVYLNAVARLNYNFSYTFTEELSEVVNNRAENGNTYKYHPKDVLTPITATVVGEIGYGSKTIELYLYYSYDVVPSVSDETLEKLKNDTDDPHSFMLSESTFMDRYKKHGFFGVGMRIFFD